MTSQEKASKSKKAGAGYMSGRKKKQGAHEEVVNTLLDLQARLRGEDATSSGVAVQSPAEPELRVGEADELPVGEMVSIKEGEIEVLVTPDPADAKTQNGFAPVTQLPTAAAADDRISSLTERLVRLEDELSAFMSKVEQARDELVADRAVQLELKLLQEVSSNRAEMLRAIDQGFARLHAAVADAKREVAERTNGETPQTDEPA